jgi:hypothetical protein
MDLFRMVEALLNRVSSKSTKANSKSTKANSRSTKASSRLIRVSSRSTRASNRLVRDSYRTVLLPSDLGHHLSKRIQELHPFKSKPQRRPRFHLSKEQHQVSYKMERQLVMWLSSNSRRRRARRRRARRRRLEVWLADKVRVQRMRRRSRQDMKSQSGLVWLMVIKVGLGCIALP